MFKNNTDIIQKFDSFSEFLMFVLKNDPTQNENGYYVISNRNTSEHNPTQNTNLYYARFNKDTGKYDITLIIIQ